MGRYLGTSNYHFVVILIYFFLVPLLIWFVVPEYNLKSETTLLASTIVLSALLLFFAVLPFFIISRKEVNLARGVKILLLAAIFAFAEELLFRGLVQGFLQSFFVPLFAVFLSSVIFGLAHILNGAAGIRIQDWNWKFVFLTFLAGIPLGTLFAVTGSLFFPTALHFLFLLFLQLFNYKQ